MRSLHRILFVLAVLMGLSWQPLLAQQQDEPLTLTVKEALALALANSPEIRGSLSEIRVATEKKEEVAAPGRFQASLVADASIVRPASGAPQQATFGDQVANFQAQSADAFPRIGGVLGVRQLLFDGGLLAAQLAAAQSEADATRMSALDSWFQLALQVRVGYLDVLRARHQVDIARESLKVAQYHLEVARKRFESGDVAEADIVYAELPVAQAELALVKAEQALENAQEVLSLRLGLSPLTRLELSEPALEAEGDLSKPEAVERALEQLPRLKMARARCKSAEHAVEAAQKAHNPQVYLAGQYQPLGFGQGNIFSNSGYEVGFRMEWPIFDGAEAHHAIKRTTAELEESLANLEKFERESERGVLVALRGVQLADATARTAEVQVKKAEEALRVAEAQYEHGFAEFMVVRDAQRELVSARMERASAGYDRLEAQARLEWAMGENPEVAIVLP